MRDLSAVPALGISHSSIVGARENGELLIDPAWDEEALDRREYTGLGLIL